MFNESTIFFTSTWCPPSPNATRYCSIPRINVLLFSQPVGPGFYEQRQTRDCNANGRNDERERGAAAAPGHIAVPFHLDWHIPIQGIQSARQGSIILRFTHPEQLVAVGKIAVVVIYQFELGYYHITWPEGIVDWLAGSSSSRNR